MDHTETVVSTTAIFISCVFSIIFIIVMLRMAYNIGQMKDRQIIMMKKINEIYKLQSGGDTQQPG